MLSAGNQTNGKGPSVNASALQLSRTVLDQAWPHKRRMGRAGSKSCKRRGTVNMFKSCHVHVRSLEKTPGPNSCSLDV